MVYAIRTSTDAVTLTSSTVSGNEAVGAGGGIAFGSSGANPALTIENSIVAGNTDSGGAPNDLRPASDGTLAVN